MSVQLPQAFLKSAMVAATIHFLSEQKASPYQDLLFLLLYQSVYPAHILLKQRTK